MLHLDPTIWSDLLEHNLGWSFACIQKEKGEDFVSVCYLGLTNIFLSPKKTRRFH